MKQKVLIVKLGITETIDHEINFASISLGDVFRTTVILHAFENWNVTWLTSREGAPLLRDNPYIHRVMIYDLRSVLQLKAEYFDVVVNLEKIPGICAFVDSIYAWRRYGFKFDNRTGQAEVYEHAYEVLANSDDPTLRKRMKKHWAQMLYGMIGEKWNEESYILGYKPKTTAIYDVGFNTNVGKRWPNKPWSMDNWKKLEKLIGSTYSISYQQSLNDIYGYIDWLNSCRLIVTNDSLGLHLAVALRKKIIALFGPTSAKEVYLFDYGVALTPPGGLDCTPCFNTYCKYGKKCVDAIPPETVGENIKRMLSESGLDQDAVRTALEKL